MRTRVPVPLSTIRDIPNPGLRALRSVGHAIKGVYDAAGRHTALACIVSAVTLASGVYSEAHASSRYAFLEPRKEIKAPPGFNGLCARYGWVCEATAKTTLAHADKIELATRVNRAVNKQVRQIEDRTQYGVDEHWALPTRRGGDCEDLVLLKKKLLMERGVPSQSLLIATVLDKKLNSHAVLVLRTQKGDLVLDNLTNLIKPWKETGYTFLKLQDPNALSRWQAVIAGGLIKDRPTASR